MAISAGTLALIGLGVAAAGATGAAVGSSINNSKARRESSRIYNDTKNFLSNEYYRDPLTAVGNRALLKSMEEMEFR